MLYRLGADALVALHLGFVIFVVLGGFLALRWRWVAWVHIPAAVWGTLIELSGWICPVTPLESHLRNLAGEAGYEGGFIEHYIIPVVYPPGLTPRLQFGLGMLVLLLNSVAYAVYFKRRRSRPHSP